MKNFGVFLQNPLENGSDDAPEDSLMDNTNVDIYPERTLGLRGMPFQLGFFKIGPPEGDRWRASRNSFSTVRPSMMKSDLKG